MERSSFNGPSTPVTEIVAWLRAYCADHPNAADTLEGVRRWWLGTSLPDARPEAVEQALMWLVTEGSIYRRVLTDGTVLFFAAGNGLP